VEFSARVRFRHPLARSAAYRSGADSAAAGDARGRWRWPLTRRLIPIAGPGTGPRPAAGPDEDVAAELERSAGRAQARGGLAAAAAFLERAALLTPDPVRRAQRLLAAARATREAGALDAALGLLLATEAGPLDAWQAAEVEHLRGQIAFDQDRCTDAARLLLRAARLLERLDSGLARETYLKALAAAMFAGELGRPGGVLEAAEAARAAPPGPDPPRAVDVLLDALALRFTEGYAAAAAALTRAVELLVSLDAGGTEGRRWIWLVGGRVSRIIALELWDFESWRALAARQAQVAVIWAPSSSCSSHSAA